MMKSELRDLVIGNTGRTDKTDLINDSLDFGLTTISKISLFDDLRKQAEVSLASGISSVQLPSDVFQIVEIRFIDPAAPTNSYQMILWRKREFTKRFPNVAGSLITGKPLNCYREKSSLFFDRILQFPYTLRLTYYYLDVFENDSDSPSLIGIDEALVAYATASVYRSIQMYKDAEYWDSQFKALINNFKLANDAEVAAVVACEPWRRDNRPNPNAPWLDPFQGIK